MDLIGFLYLLILKMEFFFILIVQQIKYHKKSKVSQREAEEIATRVDWRLRLIEQGDLALPDDCDFVTFLMSDGRVEQPVILMNPRENHPLRQMPIANNPLPTSLVRESRPLGQPLVNFLLNRLGQQLASPLP